MAMDKIYFEEDGRKYKKERFTISTPRYTYVKGKFWGKFYSDKEVDKELVAERQLEEKQKVCVDTDVLVKPDLTYKIKVCSNESVELLSINGKAIAKENN